MKYKLWVMSSVIELEADDIDEAKVIAMVYYKSNAPIAVYNTKEEAKINFPYNTNQVMEKLQSIWKRWIKIFNSIIVLQ